MLPLNGTVETPVGRLAFEGGYPSQETVERIYDRLDFQRAVQAYLWAIALVSFAQSHEVHEKIFGALLGMLDLSRTGPVVLDYPRCPTAGAIVDFWQRPVTDMGLTGPDKGAGGRYLIIGPGQSVADDGGHTVIHAPMNHIFHGFRVLSTDAAETKLLRDGYQVYP